MTVSILTMCPGCEEQELLEVSADGLRKWRAGELIQKAFPELTVSQREKLMTGYCDACWDKYMKDED